MQFWLAFLTHTEVGLLGPMLVPVVTGEWSKVPFSRSKQSVRGMPTPAVTI